MRLQILCTFHNAGHLACRTDLDAAVINVTAAVITDFVDAFFQADLRNFLADCLCCILHTQAHSMCGNPLPPPPPLFPPSPQRSSTVCFIIRMQMVQKRYSTANEDSNRTFATVWLIQAHFVCSELAIKGAADSWCEGGGCSQRVARTVVDNLRSQA